LNQQSILFSVIIPTYNRADLLIRAIQSIIAQNAPDCEIIVVDDGSEDQTVESVKSLSHPSVFLLQQNNSGQSAARNFGVEKARGEYIIFMDDDDEWLSGHLEQFRNAIAEAQQYLIYRCGFKKVLEDGKMVEGSLYNEAKEKNAVHWAATNMCGLWTLCIPKKFLSDNKSPVGYPHWQDTHLILRLLAQFPFVQLPKSTYAYHQHQHRGSVQHSESNSLFDRATLNTAAIRDLFANYKNPIQPFLPKNMLSFLLAEKYIEYAKLELLIGPRKRHWELLNKSLNAKIDWRLWKHYLLFIKYLLVK